jgi:Fic family protein
VTESITRGILSGQDFPEEQIKRAIYNLLSAFNFVQNLARFGGGQLNTGDVRELNRLCLQKISGLEEHQGKYREIQIQTVVSETENITFTPPEPEKAMGLLNDLLIWLRSDMAQELHPVLRAGIMHQRFMFISPFAVGNERTVILISRYILQHGGYLLPNLICLERYYAQDLNRYYQILVASLEENPAEERDLTEWLLYYCRGIKEGYDRVLEDLKFRKPKTIEVQPFQIPSAPEPSIKAGEEVKILDSLNERQRRILEFAQHFNTFHRRDIMSELSLSSRYHPKTTSRDLKELVHLGLLKQMGERKGVRYSLIKSK